MSSSASAVDLKLLRRRTKLFWSAHATALFLEAEPSWRKQIDDCVDLILRFPLIGTRLKLSGFEHRRRFVCAGFQIFYDLKETNLELKTGNSDSSQKESTKKEEITIRFIKRL